MPKLTELAHFGPIRSILLLVAFTFFFDGFRSSFSPNNMAWLLALSIGAAVFATCEFEQYWFPDVSYTEGPAVRGLWFSFVWKVSYKGFVIAVEASWRLIHFTTFHF